MIWVYNIILFVVGVLAAVLPFVLSWPPQAVAGALGIAVAAIYAAIRVLATGLKLGAGSVKTGASVIGQFTHWYDLVVIGGAIAAGVVMGLLL